MIKTTFNKTYSLLVITLLMNIVVGCNDRANPFNAVGVGLDDSGGSRSSEGTRSNNSWKSIDNPYYGRVLEFSLWF